MIKNKKQKYFWPVAIIIILVLCATVFVSSQKEQNSNKDYKTSFFGGEIPTSWSDYRNGFGNTSSPVDEMSIVSRLSQDGYAKYVLNSVSPNPIIFSDIPFERLDVFFITPKLKEELLSKDELILEAKKQGRFETKLIGNNKLDTITIIEQEQQDSDSKAITRTYKKYFLEIPKTWNTPLEVYYFIEYPSEDSSINTEFSNSVGHYFSTIKI